MSELFSCQFARETTCLIRPYTLPDGRVIKLGPERFMAPEVLFNPQMVNIEAPGVAEMVFNCVQVMKPREWIFQNDEDKANILYCLYCCEADIQ